MTEYLYKKDIKGIDGSHKYADFVVAHQGMILKEDEEKYWFKEASVYVPTAQEKITALEVQITPRRIREAVMGNQESIAFIKDIEAQIEVLRSQL